MSFPSSRGLRYERNVFTSLFNMMSRTLLDADSGQPAFYCTSTLGGALTIFADPQKQSPLIEGVRPDASEFKGNFSMIARAFYNWTLTDATQNRKPIAKLRSNVVKEALSWGRDTWEILDMNDQPLLQWEADGSDTRTKRILDELFKAWYNPVYTYRLTNLKGQLLATYTNQHRLFKYTYSVTFEPKITETERQIATAVFAAMTLMLKK